MASKTREITITDDKGAFKAFFQRFTGEKQEYDFEGISTLRKLLSNEKARIMHVVKTKSPGSIYKLAKLLKRDFKSVISDVKLLEKFGFLDMAYEKTGNRARLKPFLAVDSLHVIFKV